MPLYRFDKWIPENVNDSSKTTNHIEKQSQGKKENRPIPTAANSIPPNILKALPAGSERTLGNPPAI